MRWTCLFDPPRHGSAGKPSGQSPARFRLIPLIKTTSPIEIVLCEEKEDDLEALGSSNYHYSFEQVPQEEQAGCPGSPPPATGFFYLKFSVLFQFGRYQVEGLSAAGGGQGQVWVAPAIPILCRVPIPAQPTGYCALQALRNTI